MYRTIQFGCCCCYRSVAVYHFASNEEMHLGRYSKTECQCNVTTFTLSARTQLATATQWHRLRIADGMKTKAHCRFENIDCYSSCFFFRLFCNIKHFTIDATFCIITALHSRKKSIHERKGERDKKAHTHTHQKTM